MKQLNLSENELLSIGFRKEVFEGDELNGPSAYYEIDCFNGSFYCNEGDTNFKWYHKIVIGNQSNHINLNVISLPELYVVLSAFKVKFNFLVFQSQ